VNLPRELATMWKRLLKGTDEDIEIDAEYTKPALEEFLKQFKTSVEQAYDEAGMTFKYK
jgi:hypothetical protein